MKNDSIADQLKMQERQFADERENKQENIQIPNFENKFANSQITKSDNYIAANQENKQNFILGDLGVSSALGIFTIEPSPEEPKQPTIPKKKKRKPKRGFRQ